MNPDCLSRLSPRAQRMLEFATWRDEPRDREGVIRLLELKGMEPTEALIELQCCLGGLNYHIRQVKTHGWKFDIPNSKVSIEDSKSYLLYAVEHQGDPVNFGIDENGMVYMGEKSALLQYWQPFASSLQILIEADALVDEAMYLWNPCIFTVQEILGDDYLIESALEEFDTTFERVIEASDQYTKWWMDNEIRLHRYFYFSISPECFGFQVYAQDIEITKKFIRHLMKKNLIRHKEIMIFAYLESASPLYQGFP